MASIAIQGGRGETPYCALVWAMKGWSGVPKQGGCLRIRVLILVQRRRTKRISCKGQATSPPPHVGPHESVGDTQHTTEILNIEYI